MTELAEGLAAAEEAAAENPAAGNLADAALALRLKAIERERVLVDYANRGVAMPLIAARVGMTERAARVLLRDVLARSTPKSPEEFAALQMSRLNEALLVAYGAMGEMNLKAVDRVVRIVRALDRYAAVLAARPLTRTPALDHDAEAAAPALPDDRKRYPNVAEALEKVDSRSLARMAVTREAEAKRPARPAAAPTPDLARAPTGARPEIPPQPSEKSRFGRGFAPGGARRARARSVRPRREPLDGVGRIGRRAGRGRRVEPFAIR